MVTGPFTIALVVITVLISAGGFNDNRIYDSLILWPKRMHNGREPYRLLTHGFIHADWVHLLFNMYTLYMIGVYDELEIGRLNTPWLYVLLYLTGIIAAALPSFLNNRNDAWYRSLGASGGVAAVLFSTVYFSPWSELSFFGLRNLGIPSIVFALLYLAYSAYMSKRGKGNVNHNAHFWGAVYGFIFTAIIDPDHGRKFLQLITHPPFLK